MISSMHDWAHFVRAETHVLRERPDLFFQQAANQAASTAPARAAHERQTAGSYRRPWLRWVNKPKLRSRCLLTIFEERQLFRTTLCAFSPDGGRIVSATFEGIRIWDADSGLELQTLPATEVMSCLFSPDGGRVVSFDERATATLWDAITGARLAEHQGAVMGAWSPDGRYLATVGEGTVTLRDGYSGDLLMTLGSAGEWGDGGVCAVTHDGSHVRTITQQGKLKTWDSSTGGELESVVTGWRPGWAGLSCAALSADGTRLVAADGSALILWDVSEPEPLHRLVGHTGHVVSCAFSPDGRFIVSGSDDKTLKIWGTSTGSELATLIGHVHVVNACAFSPDGRRIISVSSDKTVRVWDATAGWEPASLTGHDDIVADCQFSPDGRSVLSASFDTTVRLWDVATRAELATLVGHTREVNACVISPDGRRALSASWDKTVRLWDLETLEAVRTLLGHTGSVWDCAFFPDGMRALSASEDATLRIWDLRSGRTVAVLRGHSAGVLGCAVGPDGTRIVSASSDKEVRIWDAASGATLVTLSGHDGPVTGCAISPDGGTIASASHDGTVKVWDTVEGRLLATLTGHTLYPSLSTGSDLASVSRCTFSADGRSLISSSRDHTLRVWDRQTHKLTGTLRAHTAKVNGCAASPDGAWIVSASDDGTLKLWDATIGATPGALPGHSRPVIGCRSLLGNRHVLSVALDGTLITWDRVTGVEAASPLTPAHYASAFDLGPDSTRIVSAGYKEVELVDRRSGEVLLTLTRHSTDSIACAFSPDGDWVASCEPLAALAPDRDDAVRIWNSRSGALRDFLIAGPAAVTAIAFSPDAKWIVGGSQDGSLHVWPVNPDGDEDGLGFVSAHSRIPAHTAAVERCFFSPSGDFVVSIGRDNAIQVVGIAPGVPNVTLQGATRPCALSPDAALLASGSAAGHTLSVWQVASGVLLRELVGHAATIEACAFSPDGRLLAAADRAGQVRIWDVAAGVESCAFPVGSDGITLEWDASGETLVVGDYAGTVRILALENLPAGAPIVTAWSAERDPAARAARISFGCRFCGEWTETAVAAIGTEVRCDHCHTRLRLGPVTIAGDPAPIQAAWRPATAASTTR